MSFNNFVALPITTLAFFGTAAYSSPAIVEPTPIVENTEHSEVVTEVQESVEEVNPTQEEEVARETVPVQTPSTLAWSGKIQYTQNEVRLYPQMEAICSCESGKQFHQDGTVVRGIVNPQDIGMCQINLKYHGATAESMGLDLFVEADNIRYSNWLYDQQGAQPWYLSKPCHGQG